MYYDELFQDTDASGGRTTTQDDNPFVVADVEENIKKELEKEGFRTPENTRL